MDKNLEKAIKDYFKDFKKYDSAKSCLIDEINDALLDINKNDTNGIVDGDWADDIYRDLKREKRNNTNNE